MPSRQAVEKAECDRGENLDESVRTAQFSTLGVIGLLFILQFFLIYFFGRFFFSPSK